MMSKNSVEGCQLQSILLATVSKESHNEKSKRLETLDWPKPKASMIGHVGEDTLDRMVSSLNAHVT